MSALRRLFPALFVALLVACLAPSPASAQEVITLWPDGAPTDNGLTGPPQGERCVGNVTEPTLTVFHPDPSRANGAAVLVIPGGGYAVVCVQVEGWPSAEWLTEAGFTAAVLTYRMPNGHYEVPFQDAQQAMRIIRSRAAEWGVAADRVGVMGFSAGGHLASTVGTHFTEDFSGGKGDHLELSHRPDFMILVYPVITLLPDYAHGGSARNLLGEDAPASLVARFSNQLRVTPDTPPTFLVHAGDDETVHPFNSIQFYEELKLHGIQSEFHLFDHGSHGFGLNPASPANMWDELATDWLYRLLEISR
ncbi:MAG TPA: alpha/beta hydrolase [Burkholderiales bacterium]